MFDLLKTDEIYFSKTKEYFKEVISNYVNGNYRSAVVMLYSVAICDLLLKLQELQDVYNDGIAEEILTKVEKNIKNNDKRSKSSWEKEFLDDICKKTNLLNEKERSELDHLYDHRNFSAHPSYNRNYELIMPTKEETISDIKNTMDNILIKPPFFAKGIIDMLTEDLSEKREIFYGESNKMKEYLDRVYYSHMTDVFKKNTFKALWKICFLLSDDENCRINRTVNRKALGFLFEQTDGIQEFIKNDFSYYKVSNDDECIMELSVFASSYPSIYPLLDDTVKLQLDSIIKKECDCRLTCWYKTNKINHINELMKNCTHDDYSYNALKYTKKEYEKEGKEELFCDFLIEYYGNSTLFDDANSRFTKAISPYLDDFKEKQFERLLEVSNENNQIYGRNSAQSANNEIIKAAKKKYSVELDRFPNIKYSRSVFEENKNEEIEFF